MAKTESTMLPLGTPAPSFSLMDAISGQKIDLNLSQNPTATVIMFICNHCPFVRHVNPEISRLALDYAPKHIRFIAINSNDIEAYPDDAPELMQVVAKTEGYSFPYLFDETQEVAKAYQAACTPDFFVFDKNLLLVYRGQLDDSRPGNQIEVNGKSIRAALDALLQEKTIPCLQKPSMGCNIKWKDSCSPPH